MKKKNEIRLSRTFGTITIVLIVWILLIPGVRALIKGAYDWTSVGLIGLSLIVPLMAFLGHLSEKLEQRKFERYRVLATTTMYIALAGLYLYKFANPGKSIAADASFLRIHSLGVVLLLGLALWQLFKALRGPVKAKEF